MNDKEFSETFIRYMRDCVRTLTSTEQDDAEDVMEQLSETLAQIAGAISADMPDEARELLACSAQLDAYNPDEWDDDDVDSDDPAVDEQIVDRRKHEDP
jgi:hypothetical protein